METHWILQEAVKWNRGNNVSLNAQGDEESRLCLSLFLPLTSYKPGGSHLASLCLDCPVYTMDTTIVPTIWSCCRLLTGNVICLSPFSGVLAEYLVVPSLCGPPKKPPGRPSHQNAKARFIVCIVQFSRDLIKATGIAAAARGDTLPI